MATVERPVRHGMLTKRSISKSKTTFNAKFQERWFVLTDKTLTYHTPNGHTEKGRISVNCIRCCELVCEETFSRPRLFQVVYSDDGKLRALYLQSETKQSHNEWIQSIRLVSERASPETMLRHYHSGAFIKKKWSCCHKTEKNYDSGCVNTYIYDRLSDYAHPPPVVPVTVGSRRSSTEQESRRSSSTVKRKLSLQNMMSSLKLDGGGGGKSVSSETHEEEDVFSEGELSEEEEGGSFRMKHSLDSSGNSPRYEKYAL